MKKLLIMSAALALLGAVLCGTGCDTSADKGATLPKSESKAPGDPEKAPSAPPANRVPPPSKQ